MVVPEQEGERHRVGGEGASGEERVIVEQVDKCLVQDILQKVQMEIAGPDFIIVNLYIGWCMFM